MDYTPIQYVAPIRPRFNDFDPYGHVNASCYLDYLVTSRWFYCAEKFGLGAQHFIDHGYGFYLVHYEVDYKRPILVKDAQVFVHSYIQSENQQIYSVKFDIKNEADDKTHASGLMNFAVIDLKTNKRTSMPEEFIQYFWIKN